MRDVYAIFGTLLAFGIAFPGWLFAWWLLFPGKVASAEIHLSQHPARCFGRGLIALLLSVGPTLLLASVPLPFAQLAAAAIGLLLVAFAAVGGAAIALKMAKQLQLHSAELSTPAAFLRAAVALELAAIFPLVGWLLLVPASIIIAFGAATYTLRLNPLRARQPANDPLVIDLPGNTPL